MAVPLTPLLVTNLSGKHQTDKPFKILVPKMHLILGVPGVSETLGNHNSTTSFSQALHAISLSCFLSINSVNIY